ncbi:hypothetical protein [Nocardioides convexus]|nr:hypothetical protein [Nocardioides convexus]
MIDTQTFLNLGLVLVFVLVGGVFAATEPGAGLAAGDPGQPA